MSNEDTLFQCYYPEFFAQILEFLNVEITNLRYEVHHLEKASPNIISIETLPGIVLGN